MKSKVEAQSKSDNLVLFIDESKNLLIDDQWKANNNELFSGISEILQMPEFKGDSAGINMIYPGHGKRILLASLGKDANAQSYKKVGGKIGRFLNSFEQKEIDLMLPNGTEQENQYHLLESILLGNYTFEEFKTDSKKDKKEKKKK